MKFGSIILKPSWTRPHTFQGYDLTNAQGKFACINCKSTVLIPFRDLWGSTVITNEEIERALLTVFDVPIVGKSHDGGWPRFQKVVCNSCEKPYIAYVGLDETSNGVYGITLQGIIECDT